MKIDFERLVNWQGRQAPIPVYMEDNIFNFYMNREVKFAGNKTL